MSPNKERIKIKILLPKFYALTTLILFLATVVLGIGFVYYVFGRVKIVIFPSYQKVSHEAIIDIRENADATPSGAKLAPGKLYLFTMDENISIPATGEQSIVREGIGTVTIYNASDKNQPLIATTRLLAADGTLLRIKDRIIVPKGGNIEADVYPDKPDEFTKLAPTKFTLPGLSENLQDKVYGENKSELSSGEKKIRIVSQEDIKNIDSTVLQLLDNKIYEKLKDLFKDKETFYTQLSLKEILNKELGAQAGDEKSEFGVQVKIRIVAVAFDERRVLDYVKRDMGESLGSGREIKDLDAKSIVYSIEKYSIEEGRAQIKVFAEGRAQVRQDNKIFDKKALFGKSRSDIEKYFKGFGEIEKVNIEFFPSWIPRAPRSEEKIDIVVE